MTNLAWPLIIILGFQSRIRQNTQNVCQHTCRDIPERVCGRRTFQRESSMDQPDQ